MTIDDQDAALVAELAALKKVYAKAVRAQRKIYWGQHPCAERAKNKAFDAACWATEQARDACNAVVDQLNALRGYPPRPAR